MIDVAKVASYLYNRYKSEHNEQIDEMKLHKLLYFTQREAIIATGEPMFDDQFEAWKYGPVMVRIREQYKNGTFDDELKCEELAQYVGVFDDVFAQYANKSSWNLSMLTHGEYSWKNARNGIPQDANSSALISTDDIRKDAERIKMRRFYFNELLPQLK